MASNMVFFAICCLLSSFTLALHVPRDVPPLGDFAPGLALRVLPIGDSITYGIGTPDLNSYRLDLEFLLQSDGHIVEYIGTQESGLNNPNNKSEGFSGYRINMILDQMKSDQIIYQQPNLVLIHAGTNDNDFQTIEEPYSEAPDRLGKLIDYVVCNDATAVVLVAMLIGNKYNATQTALFNAKVPEIVNARSQQGYKVQTVDMTSVNGSELSDLLHPNDVGYRNMAQLWYKAMVGIPASWWSSAVTPSALSGNTSNTTACAAPPLAATPTSEVSSSTTQCS